MDHLKIIENSAKHKLCVSLYIYEKILSRSLYLAYNDPIEKSCSSAARI